MLYAPALLAERSSYSGAHPIPSDVAGRFCHIQLAHTHTYPPGDALSPDFMEAEAKSSHFEFIGDPTDFGFRGAIHSFYGAHPIHEAGAGEEAGPTCEHRGKHAHLYAPVTPEDYEKRNNTYYFGSYQQAKRAARKSRRSRRPVSRTAAAGNSQVKPSTPVAKPKPVESSSKDPHRSWMKRRLGN